MLCNLVRSSTTKTSRESFFDSLLGEWKQVESINLRNFLEAEGGPLWYKMAARSVSPYLDMNKLSER